MLINTFLSTVFILGFTYGAGLLSAQGTVWAAVLFDIIAGVLCLQCCFIHVRRNYYNKRAFLLVGIVSYVIFLTIAILLRSCSLLHETNEALTRYLPILFAMPLIAYDSYIRFCVKDDKKDGKKNV